MRRRHGGFCAAVAAAREGAKTCVLERFGALGGTMTIGGVSAPALFHAHGKQIIAGIGWELMTTLAKNGFGTAAARRRSTCATRRWPWS